MKTNDLVGEDTGRVSQDVLGAPHKRVRSLLNLSVMGWGSRLLDFSVVCLTSSLAAWLVDLRVSDETAANYGRATVIAAFFYLLVAESLGVNDVASQLSLRTSWRRILTAWMATALVLTMLGFFLKVSEEFSRLWVAVWFAAATATLFLGRAGVIAITRTMKRQGIFNQRVAIYGAGPQGSRLAEYILGHDKLTVSIVGFYEDRLPERVQTLGIPVNGGIDALVSDIRRGLVDQVIVALPWSSEERLREIVERIALTPVRIRLAPDIAVFIFAKRPVVLLGEIPVMTLFERPISGLDEAIKWLEDHILASVLLILLSPLLLLIALAIKLDSPGPVLFRQQREGFNNLPFSVWKFRSMYVDRCETDAITQATRGDPRITRLGAFLRRTSLDELPQLFNVILGHMSLVGPRPHAPSTRAGGRVFSDVISGYAARHKVKPGITGWAQVCGWRGETRTEDQLVKRFEHDLHYVENWSLLFDLYILTRTVWTVVRQGKAF